MSTSVNAYLVNTGSHLVLVDTGAGKLFGPSLGNILRNMKASGYDPAQVDAVLITHMHGDHVGGLIDAEGKPTFSKALIYVSKAESDFWLSVVEAQKAPSEMKQHFKMAHDTADPYITSRRWKTFENGDLPIPGIKAVPIPGHSVSLGIGVGANALVGGNAGSVGLQPLSVSAQTGVDITAGITGLRLEPAPRPWHPHHS